MADLTDEDRFFGECDDFSLCRVGGNGPINVTQIMPLVKFTKDGESFLDIGCGSGTTLDALMEIKRKVKYKGTDFINHRVDWLKEHFKDNPLKPEFEVANAREIREPDKSWDVVWSRHVIDHLPDFERAFEEQCRVAKKRVICILWVGFTDKPEHEIKPVIYGPQEARITSPDEFTNQFSREKVKKYLEDKKKENWDLIAYDEHCVWDVSRDNKGDDILIILERTDA